MRSDISLVLNVLLLVLLFTRGQSSSVPPVSPPTHAVTSVSSDHVTEDPGNVNFTRTRDPAVGGNTTAPITSISTTTTTRPATVTVAAFPTHLLITSVAPATAAKAATPVHTDAAAVVVTTHTDPASSAAAVHGLSSTPAAPSSTPLHHSSPTESGTVAATDPLNTTFSSAGKSSPAGASASTITITTTTTTITTTTTQETRSESQTKGHTPIPVSVSAGPEHQVVSSQLNIVGQDLMGPPHHPSSPLDPLLAALLTVFIITTAIVFVVLFLKLRQRTTHPEFHRLQDLPMDDLMEDTPLSRYPY